MRKEWGGMGFRHIRGFNLAMLGKQGAPMGHNPSYVCRSIWSSRILLKEGYRWRIGDGADIPIWNTPWLRNDKCPVLSTPCIQPIASATVSMLIDNAEKLECISCW
ncbi:ribonuclease H [Trifolium pratense]|uniref:Ribonuclease H n=1 Tax=Trifolium pratense TaxID=57577 RepID=A0A2K3JPV6_TRIPR|nr:ribonuclease H [Trifolium pratense]